MEYIWVTGLLSEGYMCLWFTVKTFDPYFEVKKTAPTILTTPSLQKVSSALFNTIQSSVY